MRTLIPVVAVAFAAFTLAPQSQAQPLANIETVTVGDAGNAADSTGYGAVTNVFAIGKYEVTISQYTSFLNAVAATDTYSLYNPSMATELNIAGITRSGGSGSYSYSVIGSGNRPISYVNWFDAARFANWVNNGATNGASTETGAYTLNGATSGVGFTKNAGATWWIPSEDEWYKAAYYKGGGTNAGYWAYPTQSDTAPGNVVGGAANQANYLVDGFYSVTQSAGRDPAQNYLTDVGAFSNSASAYGTYDQGGNLGEWNDAVNDSQQRRGLRGGFWSTNINGVQAGSPRSSDRSFGWPRDHSDAAGIRLAAAVVAPDPGLVDADGDGVNVYREGKDGTNPNDASSFNPLSKGLVAHYPFEGNADDESGYANNGSVTGAMLSVGRLGQSDSAYYFDGSSVITGGNVIPNYKDGATLSCWVKTSHLGSLQGAVCKPRPYGDYGGFALGVSNRGRAYTGLNTDPYYNSLQGGVIANAAVQSYSSIADDRWHHLVATIDGNTLKLYLDGLFVGSEAFLSDPITSDRPLQIGREGEGGGAQYGPRWFFGSLDDVRIYNRALSPTEVNQLYQAEVGNLDTDGDGLTDAWENGFGRYQIVEGNFNWEQAKADAESRGGHLATITSIQEHEFLRTIFPGYANATLRPWLGASDAAQEGVWKWVTGEIWGYTRWWPGEPNDSFGGQDYLWSGIDYVWESGSTGQLWDDTRSDPTYPELVNSYLLEFGYPTDPFKPDTDGDGYNDKVETDAKTDPNNPASFPVPLDADGDGIPDANETSTGVYVSPTDTGTDPNNPDTDGDGLSDGVETATGTYVSPMDTGTDPNIPDTDGDGLSDSVETNTGVYVSATNTGTNPLNDDTSSDGITDGEAVTAQFNPLIDQRQLLNFLTQAVAAQPNRFGFYNEANVMHLGMGGLMIRKSGSAVNIDLQWQTKTSLTDAWTNHGAPLPFFLNLPGSKAFIRLQATPGTP